MCVCRERGEERAKAWGCRHAAAKFPLFLPSFFKKFFLPPSSLSCLCKVVFGRFQEEWQTPVQRQPKVRTPRRNAEVFVLFLSVHLSLEGMRVVEGR